MMRGMAVLIAASVLAAPELDAQTPADAAARTVALAPGRALHTGRAAPADGMVRIWTVAGSVRVVAWDADSVDVTGESADGRPFHCFGAANALKCGSWLSSGDMAPPTRLEYRVPRNATVWIKSASADIVVEGLAGTLEAYSVTGAVRVDGATHVVAIESMAGDIDVRGTSATLRLRSGSGSISLAGSSEDVDASSVSGRLVIDGARIARGRFDSIDGGVLWSGPIARDAVLEFSSHSGPVVLRLPRTTAAHFSLSCYNGWIRSNFGDGIESRPTRPVSRTYTFTVPPGGARVTVRNFKGSISLLHD